MYGVAVIAVAIFLPRGLVGLLWSRANAKPAEEPVELPEPAESESHQVHAIASPWLEVRGVSKRFGGLVAVNDVTFSLQTGTITALIGPNGAGKTTLFNAIDGVIRPDAGSIVVAGHEVVGWQPHRIAALGVARSFQNARLFGDMTVAENVEVGTPAEGGLRALHRFGIARLAATPARDLAFGDRRRVELARAAAGNPGLLLLDEPAAGLNASERRSLARRHRCVARRRHHACC